MANVAILVGWHMVSRFFVNRDRRGTEITIVATFATVGDAGVIKRCAGKNVGGMTNSAIFQSWNMIRLLAGRNNTIMATFTGIGHLHRMGKSCQCKRVIVIGKMTKVTIRAR